MRARSADTSQQRAGGEPKHRRNAGFELPLDFEGGWAGIPSGRGTARRLANFLLQQKEFSRDARVRLQHTRLILRSPTCGHASRYSHRDVPGSNREREVLEQALQHVILTRGALLPCLIAGPVTLR